MEIGAEEIKRAFPLLNPRSYDPPHGEEDFNYNCLAFVLGDLKNWWEPPALFGHYWPPGFPEDTKVATVVSILKVHGFVVERDPKSQLDAVSVAIYAKGEEWEHFSKFDNGRWWSKLGGGHDVWHSTLEELEGGSYGRVVKVLSRERTRNKRFRGRK